MIDVSAYWFGSSPSLQLIRFITVLVVGTAVSRLLGGLSQSLYRGDDDVTQSTIKNITTVLLLFVTFILALDIAGFGDLLTVLTAFGAAATVAVGFGVRDQIGNILAGVFIYANTPYVEGDRIRINDTEGVVKDTALRTTTITNNDGTHIIPNGMVTTNVLTNQTRAKTTAQNLTVNTNVEHSSEAQDALLDAVKAADEVKNVPAPKITVVGVEPTTTTLKATYTIKSSKQSESVKSDILKAYTESMQTVLKANDDTTTADE